jgi:hypothetical protein
MLIVGGINELTLEAFEEDRIDRLGELGGPIAEVVRGVVGADFLVQTGKRRRASSR